MLLKGTDIYSVNKPIVGDLARVHLIQRVFEILGGNQTKILDVGCGDGSLWLPFLNHISDLEISGIDRDRVKIEKGLKELKKSNLVCGDIYKLSSLFPGEYFSLVVSTQVFSYIKRLDKALEEINRVMVDKGKLLFTIGCTGYRKSWKDQFRRRIAGWFIEKYYFREYDEKELETLLGERGFQVEDVRFYTVHPLKEIHNKIISEANKNKFLNAWKEMEDILAQDDDFRREGKPYCLSIFMECKKF